MLLTSLAILLLLQAAQAAPEVRSLQVSVSDEKGAPIEFLTAEEVAVVENGVARDLLRFERDSRPLLAAVIVDSSQEVGTSFRLNVIEAVASFIARLPEGSRYALWTTGDRPTKIVDLTDDVSKAGPALRRVFPQGGNTLLDALVEASRELKTLEGRRSAVISVSGAGIGFTNYDRQQVVREAGRSGAAFLSVQFNEGSAPSGFGSEGGVVTRADYDFVLSSLAAQTGGRHETPLSSMGLGSALQKLAADLRGQYRLSYATLPGLKERKVEVQVARPGARVRLSPTTPQSP